MSINQNSKNSNFLKRTLRRPAKLTRYQRDEAIQFALNKLVTINAKPSEIQRLLMVHYPDLNQNQASRILSKATQRLIEITAQDVPTMVAVHIEKYEQIWQYFNEIGHAKGQLKALKAKERLLGLIQKSVKLKVNQTINKKPPEEKVVRYDLTRLTSEELAEFNELMNKAS